MNSKMIKKLFKEKYNLTVRMRTIPGKAPSWIDAWIPYSTPTGVVFLLEFRRHCLTVVYPNHPEFAERGYAGNISGRSISLTAPQWAQAFALSEV